jgi:two-component system NarL family response regulator
VIRVAVVDDHPIVRDGIVANLAAAEGLAVVATGGSLAQARTIVERERPDVVILDLELPDGNGLEAIAQLKALLPKVRIVVFSAYAGEDRVRSALGDGADSYVLKGTPSDELIRAVRAVAAGETYLGPQIAAQVVGALHAPRRLRITEREREILRHLAAGLSNKQIAALLGVSERTVKFHVSEILGRLEADNRAQAVAIAQRRGLV